MLFLFLLACVLILEALDIEGAFLQYARYTLVVSLAVGVFIGRKHTRAQRILFLSFPLMVFGDFFLVFSYSISGFPNDLRPLGFIFFGIAYILMTIVYIKGFQITLFSLSVMLTYTLIFSSMTIFLSPYIDGVTRYMGVFVLATVTIAAMAGLMSLGNKTYSGRTSGLMALSSGLMLICDYGVAVDLFYPDVHIIRELLPVNIVWISYVPGWMLLGVIILEDRIYRCV